VIPLLVEQPERLRRFLRDHVSGYEELETLLLVASQGARDWTDSEVAALLNVPIEPIAAALESLSSAGILESLRRRHLVAYRYAPRTEMLREDVLELQRAYSEERLTVMQIMSGNALERVRTAALQRFADAFRLEGNKKK
jgi:hypothetical protein